MSLNDFSNIEKKKVDQFDNQKFVDSSRHIYSHALIWTILSCFYNPRKGTLLAKCHGKYTSHSKESRLNDHTKTAHKLHTQTHVIKELKHHDRTIQTCDHRVQDSSNFTVYLVFQQLSVTKLAKAALIRLKQGDDEAHRTRHAVRRWPGTTAAFWRRLRGEDGSVDRTGPDVGGQRRELDSAR